MLQKGHSFELATVLCSLLIGFGYDAYVVSGYAVRDVTENILIRIDSPIAEETTEEETEEADIKPSKYAVQPPRDLKSKFLQMLKDRKQNKILEQEEKKAEQERLVALELEKRPFDKLEGQRVHAWVLLKPGKEVETCHFIEPSTGFYYDLDCDLYCGIESVWNNKNYWVNMQHCTDGLGCTEFDFTDVTKWEHLLVGEPIQLRQEKGFEIGEEEEEKENKIIYQEKHLDMPEVSWGLPLSIPYDAFQMKFPQGCKTAHYKKTIVEQYAPYIQVDGLVTRIVKYKDFDCFNLLTVEEQYKNRRDKLYKTVHDLSTHLITEFFKSGREDGVIKHSCYYEEENFDAFRIIEYANRYDGLIKIETGMRHLTETYSNREDFLNERYTEFGRHRDGNRRVIFKIIQKYGRNIDIPFSEDISEVIFNIALREISIMYHYGPCNITASTRDFQKPPPAEIGEVQTFHPELTTGYQAEIDAKPPKMLKLFNLLEKLMKDEEKLLDEIRVVEAKELRAFLELRNLERIYSGIDISLFNRVQNSMNRTAMLEREAEMKLKAEKEIEEDIDYLSPFLINYSDAPSFSKLVIQQIKTECLEDYVKMLVHRANALQHRFDAGSDQLTQNQSNLTINYDRLSPQEIQDLLDKIQDNIFYLHTLEIRLSRFKSLASERYKRLKTYLDNHEKLQVQIFDLDYENI